MGKITICIYNFTNEKYENVQYAVKHTRKRLQRCLFNGGNQKHKHSCRKKNTYYILKSLVIVQFPSTRFFSSKPWKVKCEKWSTIQFKKKLKSSTRFYEHYVILLE